MFLQVLLLPFIYIATINGSKHSLNQQGGIEESTQNEFRLPNTIIPTSYELRIDTDFDNFTFSGTVQISIHVKFTTRRIILHSQDLIIDDIQLTNNNAIRISHSYNLDKANTFLIIESAEKLIYDSDYSLTIQFRGMLNNKHDNNTYGFYRDRYVLDGKTHWLAVSQFEADCAREAFPCFDEPRFRAPFTVYLAHSKDHVAISNMPSEEVLPQQSSNGTRVWEKFQQTPHLPTYLIYFMVSDYKHISSEDGRIRVFARPDAIDKCTFALQQSIKLLDYLEGYTGIKFTSPKLDIVALPKLEAVGMENWGMITYSEEYVVLYDANDEVQKFEITALIAHEIAHQWFGDLVTPSWYSYLWLKEGFAQYLQTYAAIGIDQTKGLESFFVTEVFSCALSAEPIKQRAMTTSILDADEINDLYDEITYNKGGSVIRMWEHAVTSDTFQAALHNFLKDGDEKQHGVVTPHDLFNAFDKQTEQDAVCQLPQKSSISDFMRVWTENIGYPLITVTRSYENGQITITQTTYKTLQIINHQPDQQWIVPLTYTTKSEAQFSNTKPTLWSFADTPITLQDIVNASEWILFNLQNTGYYRVNYDDRNWQLIIDQLNEDKEKIHPFNRALLIRDVIALWNDKMLNPFIAESLLKYLTTETDLIPWYSLTVSFVLLQSESEETSVYSSLKKLVYASIKNPLKILGFEAKSPNGLLAVLKPIFLKLACDVGNEQCIQQSLDEYKKNENDITKVQSHLKNVVYCNALRHSKDTDNVLNNLWNVYVTNNNYVRRQILRTLLSCTAQNENIVKKVLSKITNPKNAEVVNSDTFTTLKETTLEASMVTATMKFIDEQISLISNLTDDSAALLKNLLQAIESKITTSEQIKLLKTMEAKSSIFYQKHGKLNDVIKKLYAKIGKKISNDSSFIEKFRKNFSFSQENV